MEKAKISGIIIVKNEADKIEDCLQSIDWVDEIIVVDSGSTDKTLEIASEYTSRIYSVTEGSFNDWRNKGLKESRSDWVFYLDADERVTPLLRKEIETLIQQKQNKTAYAIPRKNIVLGREMKHGGWWPDYVKRLFLKDALSKWEGRLHEEPVFTGKMGRLKNFLIHLKETDIADMVEKTNRYSEIEAGLLFAAHHPRMSWWRFLRVMLSELWLRIIREQGFLDGREGIIFAFYQAWSKFVTYAKLWEMQIKDQGLKTNR